MNKIRKKIESKVWNQFPYNPILDNLVDQITKNLLDEIYFKTSDDIEVEIKNQVYDKVEEALK
jgi:hypothetical protein